MSTRERSVAIDDASVSDSCPLVMESSHSFTNASFNVSYKEPVSGKYCSSEIEGNERAFSAASILSLAFLCMLPDMGAKRDSSSADCCAHLTSDSSC